jgi:adenosylcobinamide-GDP ribazoletransferase
VGDDSHPGRALLLAGRFLTRWPFPVAADAPPTLYGHAAPYYPLIGLLLGVVLAGAALAAAALGVGAAGAPVLAALLLLLWVWSTGALHLDGLADCADAWVGGLGSRERTFAILKDPHIGSMGVVALVLVLLAKFAALAVLLAVGLAADDAGRARWLWVLPWVPLLARAQILWLALGTRAARPEGLGAVLDAHLPRRAAWLAAGLGSAVGLAGIAAVSAVGAVVAGGLMAAVLLRWRQSLRERLGGYTGDGIGALVELTETCVLLGLALVAA